MRDIVIIKLMNFREKKNTQLIVSLSSRERKFYKLMRTILITIHLLYAVPFWLEKDIGFLFTQIPLLIIAYALYKGGRKALGVGLSRFVIVFLLFIWVLYTYIEAKNAMEFLQISIFIAFMIVIEVITIKFVKKYNSE